MTKLTIDELKARTGEEIGLSAWIEVPQAMIDQFADVTRDHQFIHVDPVKAKMTPFGGTVAHGFLTVSLLSAMAYDGLPGIKGQAMGVNYGFDRLRLISPVKAGAKIRGRFVLKGVESKSPQQHQVTYAVTVEIEGESKPAMAAEWVTLAFTM